MTLRAVSEDPRTRYEPGTYELRHWEVRLRPWDDRIGRVDDVLVDGRGHICYLDVALRDGSRHVLVPAGHAEAEALDRTVWVWGLTEGQLQSLPEYGHDPASVDREYETAVASACDSSEGDFYERPDFAASWGRGKNTTASGKLVRLDQLDDVDVAKGDPDPRGWEVTGAEGEKLGTVRHLIGDLDAMRVLYLTVQVDETISEARREVLIPVGHVLLESQDKEVHVPVLDRRSILAVPAYEGGEVTREHERALGAFFGEAYSDEGRYDHPRYRHDRLHDREGSSGTDVASLDGPVDDGITVRRWRVERRASPGELRVSGRDERER